MTTISIFLNNYISPTAYRLLIPILILTITVIIVIVRRWYSRYWLSPIRIQKKVWYSGGLKISVKIMNKSRSIVEIGTPVIEFRQARMPKRRFKINPPGKTKLFPLGLMPHTNYEFQIELIRFYDYEERLRKYKKAMILVNDPKGRKIMHRKIKLSIPK